MGKHIMQVVWRVLNARPLVIIALAGAAWAPIVWYLTGEWSPLP